MGVLGIVGTNKAGFLIRSDRGREDWKIEGPIFKGWKVTASTRDPAGRYVVATASPSPGSSESTRSSPPPVRCALPRAGLPG